MKLQFLMLIVVAFVTASCGNKTSDATNDASQIEKPSNNKEVFTTDNGAIDGYDVVSYFSEGKPVKGDTQFNHDWNGATWHFSSVDNMELFKAAPEKYAPQFGGYCAYGTAQGHKAPTQPDAWTLVDGKLYLNYNKDVQIKWTKDRPGFIEKANANWPKVKLQEFN